MPLLSGSSSEVRSKNIEELINSGYDPKQAEAIAYAQQRRAAKDEETAREPDGNGWVEIKGNPISKVGVFPYTGAQISEELDPDKIYYVYRPEEELANEETIKSFRLLPWTDEHSMLGNEDEGLTPAEQKGIHGVIGEDVYFEDGYLKGNLKIFSDTLARLIENGKKELSIGYRCLYEMSDGVYNGQHYDAIQRQIRGNHIALVDEGRSGKDVAVLDSFKITCDSGRLLMPVKGKGQDENEMTLADVIKMLQELKEKVDKLDESRGELKEEREEGEDENEELSEKAAKEGDAKDVEPDDFVKKADVTEDADEDKDKDDDKKDMKDEDLEKPEGKEPKVSGMDTKALLKEISMRDKLASRLSDVIGTFDHATKTLDEVAQYGVKKLGLSCRKGHEISVLDGYFAAVKVSKPVAMAEDNMPKSSMVDAYLNGGK